MNLDPLLDTIARMRDRIDRMPNTRWGTVTSTSPLRVQMDGDQTPMSAAPDNVVGPLVTGQRVRVEFANRRATITAVAGGSGVPVGTMVAFMGETPPAGWLLCDGATYAKSRYPALAEVLGNLYGGAETTFAVPSLSGRVPMGIAASWPEASRMGQTGGEKTHTLTVAEMPAHSHTQRYTLNAAKGTNMGGMAQAGSRDIPGQYSQQVTLPTGGGGAHNNLPPFIVTKYIIKY